MASGRILSTNRTIDSVPVKEELQTAGNLTPEATRGDAPVIGDPRLHQIRDFLDEEDQPPANPLQIAQRAFRGRLILTFSLVVILAVVFGAGAFLLVSPKYQSQGLIRVAARVPKVMYSDPNDPRLRLFDSFVSAEVTYLQSRPVLERSLLALAQEGSSETARALDVNDLGRMISVRKDKGLITVAATSPNPEQASKTVNALLESYTALHQEASTQAQTIRERQLVDRERELLSKLTEINGDILEVGEEHGTTSIAKAHLNKVTQLEDIDQRISELETTIAQVEAQETSTEFDTGDEEIKRVTVLDKAMADMTYDRAKRAADMESLKLRYRHDHPRVRELEIEIRVIDEAIEARRQQIVTLGNTGALTSGRGEEQDEESLEGLRTLREKLGGRRMRVAAEAKQLNSKLIELTFLKEEHTEIRSLLDETRRTLEEVRVESRNSMPGSVEVIAYGATPKKPVEDKRFKLSVAGSGAGILSALGLVVLGSIFRSRVRYSDELSSTVGEDRIAGVLPSSAGSPALFLSAVHRLRNHLQLTDGSERSQRVGQVIMVSGVRAGSGASTVTLSLADSFRLAGMSTLVVDADLSSNALSGRLDLETAPGLRECIASGDSIAPTVSEDGSGRAVVTAGACMDIRDEHLSLPKIRSIIAGLREQFQIVIVDAGPSDTNLSANLIAALADQVLIVTRAEEDAPSVLRISKRLDRVVKRAPLFALYAARSGDPGLSVEVPAPVLTAENQA